MINLDKIDNHFIKCPNCKLVILLRKGIDEHGHFIRHSNGDTSGVGEVYIVPSGNNDNKIYGHCPYCDDTFVESEKSVINKSKGVRKKDKQEWKKYRNSSQFYLIANGHLECRYDRWRHNRH